MLINEEELKRMGKGWFILKYAQEHGIIVHTNLDYGTATSMKTRENAYERTRNSHHMMISELKKADFTSNIRAGNPELSSNDIKGILFQL